MGLKLIPYLILPIMIFLTAIYVLVAQSTTLLPHAFLANDQMHSVMEAFGSVIAIIVGIILLQKRYDEMGDFTEKCGRYFLLGTAFIVMGIFDGLHASSRIGDVSVFLHSAGMLVGGVLFSLLWFFEKRNRLASSVWLPWIIAFATIVAGIFIVSSPSIMPSFLASYRFTYPAVVINMISGLLFIAAAVKLMLIFRMEKDAETYLILCLALLFGLAGVTFQFSSPWNEVWWLWHFLRLIAYLLVLVIIFAEYERIIADLRNTVSIRKRAQEIVDEHSRSLSHIIESISQPFFVIDAQSYTVRLANTAAIDSGISIGSKCFDTVYGKNAKCKSYEHPCPIEEIRRTGKHVVLEYTIEEDGHSRQIEIHGYPITDKGGKLIRIAEYNIDITERKKAMQAVKDSEEKFRLMTESIHDVFWMSTPTFDRLIYLSPAYGNVWGRPREEAYANPMSIIDAIHTDDRAKVVEILKNASAGDWMINYRIIKPDGTIRWIENRGFPIRNQQGDVEKTIGIASDITTKINFENTIRGLNEQQKMILDSVPAMIWYKDTHNRFIRANSAALKLAGLKKEDVEGKSCADIFPEDADKYYKDDLEIINSKKLKSNIVERMKTASGEVRWIKTDRIPIFGEGGHVAGVIVFALDITDQRTTEEELRIRTKLLEDANEKLHDLDKIKSQFVANVSHEFKSPLTSISQLLELILDGSTGAIPERQQRPLERAYHNVKRLHRLVTDLLDLSRIEMGKVEIKRQKVYVFALLEEVISTHEMELTKRGMRLDKDIPESIGFIWADRDRLHEVFENIFNNAVKYSSDNTTIGIKAHKTADTMICEFSDQGPGIAKEDQDRIFDKFERITSERQEGTGLGLPIAKDIVELHHGKVRVESESGKGSTFIVELPIDLRSEDRPES